MVIRFYNLECTSATANPAMVRELRAPRRRPMGPTVGAPGDAGRPTSPSRSSRDQSRSARQYADAQVGPDNQAKTSSFQSAAVASSLPWAPVPRRPPMWRRAAPAAGLSAAARRLGLPATALWQQCPGRRQNRPTRCSSANDIAYSQCMYSKGKPGAGLGPRRRAEPVSPYPPGPPPPYPAAAAPLSLSWPRASETDAPRPPLKGGPAAFRV